MANANPTQFSGRPGKEGKWYGTPTEQPGLSPVALRQPANATTMERRTCACGLSYMLTDVEPEVLCDCGEVVKL